MKKFKIANTIACILNGMCLSYAGGQAAYYVQQNELPWFLVSIGLAGLFTFLLVDLVHMRIKNWED